MFREGAIFPPLPTVTRGRCCKIDCTSGDELILSYCNGSNVLVRNLSNNELILFDGHKSTQVQVAKFSPCQKVVASGDSQGNLLIWDIERVSGKKQGNAVLLNQKLWPGPINDVGWSSDGKFLFIVGADSILWNVEKQTRSGKVNIHTRPINSVSWRMGEACTGSDDFSVALFSGSPMGLQKTLNDHSNFVQQVAFSPSGKRLVSVGSDKKIVVHNFDDKSGISDNAVKLEACHEGSIFGVAWIDDDSLVTCSADKTIKFWQLQEDKICLETQLVLEHQILGLTMNHKNKKCIFISLEPSLTIVNCKTRQIEEVIHGHTTGVTQLFSQQNHIYSLDKEGWLCEDMSKRMMQLEDNSFICMNNSNIASLAYGKLVFLSNGKQIRSVEGVNSICSYQSRVWYVSSAKAVLQCCNFDTFEEGIVHSIKEEISQMACNEAIIFLYAPKKSSILVFDVEKGLKYSCSVKSVVTCFSISPDSLKVAIGYQNGLIQVFGIRGDKLDPVVDYEWSAHCAIVNQIYWIDNHKLLSCSLDKCIIEWSLNNKLKWKIHRGAHFASINSLCPSTSKSTDKNISFLSASSDGCIKEWKETE